MEVFRQTWVGNILWRAGSSNSHRLEIYLGGFQADMGQEYTTEGRVFRQTGVWNILGEGSVRHVSGIYLERGLQSDMGSRIYWGGGVSRQTGVRNILVVEGGFPCRHGSVIYTECGGKGVFSSGKHGPDLSLTFVGIYT